MLAGLGVCVLLAVCGLTGYFIISDERAGTDAQANGGTPGPSTQPRDISSRTVDPAPLTVEEVFGAREIAVVAGQPAYTVLGTQASADCRVGATDDLSKQLTAAGCSQVVRATMRSPTGEYLVTGGILNLVDNTAADRVHAAVKPIIDGQKGRFTGLIAGRESEPIVRSSTHLGWDIRGHYLVYCVIARFDGKEFQPGDPYAKQIIYDVIVLHLRNTVIEKRATAPVTTPAAGG